VTAATDVLLAPLTTLRLGGPAGRVVEARTEDELVRAVREADEAGEPLLLLAGGSNVVVADAGFPGVVVRVLTRGVRTAAAGEHVRLTVQAGEPWDALVERTVRDGLAGLECLSGIPGSTGATPIQNVGAYGQEVAATIDGVRVFDRTASAVAELGPGDCGFRYRGSRFKGTATHVVLAVTFLLRRSALSEPIRYAELARELGLRVGDRAPLGEVRAAVLALRRAKGMVVDPADPDAVSAGSFFTNPVLDAAAFAALERRARERLGDGVRPPRFPEPDGRTKTSAAWLIERAGFAKGLRRGPVGLSGKHALALVNLGGARTEDLVALAREIAAGVREAFGVDIVPEPVFVGHRWERPGPGAGSPEPWTRPPDGA
jgi:UDP-N-acetylmuramate dehydrogenase